MTPAAVAANASGPSLGIGSTSPEIIGPKQCDWQQQPLISWAIQMHQQHLPKNNVPKCSCKCNGPIPRHLQHLSKNNQAQATPSAAAAANIMGQSNSIGSTSKN